MDAPGGPLPPAAVVARVQDALADTPYTVVATADGFEVLVHLSWRVADTGAQVSATYLHRVDLEPARGEYIVTDEIRRRTAYVGLWQAASHDHVERGRFRHVLGSVDVEGVRGTFRSEPARRRVVETVDAAGWTSRTSPDARRALVIGLGAAALALLLAAATAVTLLLVL